MTQTKDSSDIVEVPRQWFEKLRELANDSVDFFPVKSDVPKPDIFKVVQLLGYIESVKYILGEDDEQR